VRALVEWWAADEFEALGSIESPDDEKMRKAFDIGESEFELRENFKYALRIVFCAEAFGDGFGVSVGAANKSDGFGIEHVEAAPMRGSR
jgi:hypothetical protein